MRLTAKDPQAKPKAAKILSWLEADAAAHGFATLGIASADLPPIHAGHLQGFIASNYHGTMAWMARTAARRANPKKLWPAAKSAIVLAMNYAPDKNPLDQLDRRKEGAVSVYAQNRDYHDVIKGRLKIIAGRLAARTGAEVKVFVDTAPLMEKPLAARTGLGWQGKHTNLVSRGYGSWLFLGVILTDLDLPTHKPEADHCGSCRACLDICPTRAFPAPYRLDARRCISYLTIEHEGQIPREFRKAMGNRIYGCDDCLAVCPWNKFAKTAREHKLRPRADLQRPALAALAQLDEAGFRALFSGSPIKRIGYARFLRNVLIATGNSGQRRLAPLAAAHLQAASPLMRGAAVWALGQLLPRGELAQLSHHAEGEADESVRAEWRDVLKQTI